MNKRVINRNGFTMIEVLIAVLILSIGLLGLAGLQTYSLKNNHSAYLRSQSTFLAYDIVDRIRANSPSATAYSYNSGLATPPPAPTGSGITLTDLTEWRTALMDVLPAASGSIAISGSILTVIVQWDDSRGESAAQQFTLTTQI